MKDNNIDIDDVRSLVASLLTKTEGMLNLQENGQYIVVYKELQSLRDKLIHNLRKIKDIQEEKE